MRHFLPFLILFSSCTSFSSREQARKDSLFADSIALAKSDSAAAIQMTKEVAAQMAKNNSSPVPPPAADVNPNDFAFFSSFPDIAKKGKSIGDFIPSDWKLRDSVSYDFNEDGRIDFAVVLQHKDSVRMVDFANDFVDTLLTQPRMLIVLLHNNSNSGYELSVENHFFIPNYDRPNMQDPFESMEMTNGNLQFKFQYFAYAGSWEVSNLTYKFRYKNGVFFLIGGDYMDFMRNSGAMEECSYNFLTKQMKLTTGENMFDEHVKGNVQWETIEIEKLQTLENMQPAGMWEVKKGHYL